MVTIWGMVCTACALALTGVGAGCALVALRGPRRAFHAILTVTITAGMVASTLDMLLSGPALLSPLAWAALLLVLALLALLDTRRRTAAALHAAGVLFMAVMWLAMLPSGSSGSTGLVASVGSAGQAPVHLAHAGAFGAGALPFGWVLIAASVTAVALVGAAALRRGIPNARHAGHAWSLAGTDRLVDAHHASMALAMSVMTAGMIVPVMFG